MLDVDGDVYYGQIRGLLQDQYCEKSAVITWLLPTDSSPKDRFDPSTYIVGKDIPLQLIVTKIRITKREMFNVFRSRRGTAKKTGMHGICVSRPIRIF